MDKIEQIEQMRMGIDFKFPVSVRSFSINLRPLSLSEQAQVTADVMAQLKLLPEEQRTRIKEHQLHVNHTIVLASTTDFGTNDPKISHYILERCTDRELQAIWQEYCAICDRVDPALEKMDKDKINVLVDELKKNPHYVSECSFLELVNICRHLIIEDSPTDK